ncbi:Farnesyl diphosphate synthase [compost metagenome]
MTPSTGPSTLESLWTAYGSRIEAELDRIVPPSSELARTLWESMRYSVLAGGKRIRPLFGIAAALAAGGKGEDAIPAGCALELIHTQSLIHDDLPCMDDDELRRGRPTNHVVYGEAMALLAGDGLLAHAFQVLAQEMPKSCPPERALLAVAELAGATLKMVEGQVVDMQAEGKPVEAETLSFIHRHKTGALIVAAVRLGGHVADAPEATMERLTRYAEHVGLAFQIVDDILDLTGTAEALGKSPGKDLVAHKATYPALYGLDQARSEADRQIQAALDAIAPLGERAAALGAIARFVSERNR